MGFKQSVNSGQMDKMLARNGLNRSQISGPKKSGPAKGSKKGPPPKKACRPDMDSDGY